jgi:hypothetical protein
MTVDAQQDGYDSDYVRSPSPQQVDIDDFLSDNFDIILDCYDQLVSDFPYLFPNLKSPSLTDLLLAHLGWWSGSESYSHGLKLRALNANRGFTKFLRDYDSELQSAYYHAWKLFKNYNVNLKYEIWEMFVYVYGYH